MIQEEIARLTGKLVFQVDNRPLMAFEKRLDNVIGQLRQLETLANKKFNIKVQLDSRTLRDQLAKAASAKVTLRDVNVSAEAMALAAKRIMERLDSTPITLNKIRIDIANLVQQKKLIRTLLGQMDVGLTPKFKMGAATAALAKWRTETESKFTLRINATISEAKFLRNAREALSRASAKLGPIKLETPNIKVGIDRAHLKQEIADVLAQIRRETTIRVDLQGSSRGRSGVGGATRAREAEAASGLLGRGGRLAAASGGIAGAIGGSLVPGLGAAMAFSHLNDVNQELVGQRLAMQATMGSQASGDEQLAWVKNLANTLGLDYRQTTPNYTKMLANGHATGMSTEAIQKTFQGTAEYGRVMGLGQNDMKLVMLALEQMMGKGQVMAQELKLQLGQRMPGAEAAMAQAAGFGTGKDAIPKLLAAMKKGDVHSADVMEKFGEIMAQRARQGGALEKHLESTAAQQGRFNNAVTDSIKVFSEAGFDKGMGSFFMALTAGLEKAQPLIEALGGAFEILIRPVNAAIDVFGTLAGKVDSIASIFGLTGKQLEAIIAVVGISLLPFGSLAIVLGALALAIQDVMVYMEGGDSLFGRFLSGHPEAKAAMDDIVHQVQVLGTYLTESTGFVGDLAKSFEGLTIPDMFIATLREIDAILKTINAAIDRFRMAGAYAESQGGGTVERNYNNMKAMAMGPDWARQQMQDQILNSMSNSIAQTPDGIPMGNDIGASLDAVRQAVDRLAAIQAPMAGPQQIGDISIKVDVAGGIMSAGDLTQSLADPMHEIAMKAFGNVIGESRNAQSEVRR